MSRIYRTLGTVAMTPKGEYDSSAYYEKLNVVTYNGSSYVALQNTHGNLPTNTTYWQLLAQKGAKTYNNVAEMKADTDLKDGMVAETLGYYGVNDGGGASYKITSEESETDYQEGLENGLYATLIVKNNMINIKQVGGKTDDETFNNAVLINLINDLELNIFIPKGIFYISTPILLNIEKSKICGQSTTSIIKQASTFIGDELILIYSNNGAYNTRNNRIKTIHDFSLQGIYGVNGKIAIKIGGDTGTTYEGHVDCVQYENIHIKNVDIGLYLNSHLYRNVFTNIIIDQVNYSIKSDDNQSDQNESTNFIGCSFWSGSMYLKMDSNFIGCTLHVNHQEEINSVICNLFIDNCDANFTDCHFESLNTSSVPLTRSLENIIVSRYAKVTIDNPIMLVSGDNITINDSVFKTINPTSSEVKQVSSIILKNGTCKYFFGRITPGTNFILCKGNIEIFTNTIYRNDGRSQLGYKMYDYSKDNILTDTIINPIIKADALSNAIMSINNNTYNFTKSSEATNKFGMYKIFRTNGHKSLNFFIKANSNVSNVKIQKRYSSLAFDNSSIVFLDKDGDVIDTTLNLQQYSDGQSMDTNAYLNIPENCEYIKFGIIGYGFQYQTNVTFTIEKLILELC